MANGKAFDETGLNIRPASNADAARISELVSRVLAEFGLEFDPGATDSDLADIEGEYFDRGGLFEVIDDADGQILGTYGLWPIDHAAVELRKMYFAKEIRGRGLGRKLLNRAVTRARELGFSRIYLETAAVLEGAVKLYESFGFLPVDVVHSKRCDQGYQLDLTME